MNHLAILARILKASRAALALSDFNTLKEVVFMNPNVLNDLMMAPVPPVLLEGESKRALRSASHLNIFQGIRRLLASSFDPSSQTDRFMVSNISQYWFNMLKSGVDEQAPASVS